MARGLLTMNPDTFLSFYPIAYINGINRSVDIRSNRLEPTELACIEAPG